MNVLRYSISSIALTIAAAIGASIPYNASGSITFDLSTEFSGATEPVGATPWAKAKFEDIGPGAVRLTMTTPDLTNVEFIPAWYFNLNSALSPLSLAFSPVSVAAVGSFTISLGANTFKADGDGYFDIRFNFPNDSSANRLMTGETLIFDISYGAPLPIGVLFNEASFNYGSAPGGGNGTWYSAAKVQGIGSQGQQSGWIGAGPGTFTPPPPPPPPPPGGGDVPEPISVVVWSLLIGGCAVAKRRGR